MAKSKDILNPINPRDFSNLIRDGKSVNQHDAGTVVVRDSAGQLVECDTTDIGNDASNVFSAVEFIWDDAPNRFDTKQYNYDPDAHSVAEVYRHTTVPADFIAEVSVSDVFDTASPQPGDLVLKSLTSTGNLEAYSDSEISSAITAGDFTAAQLPGLTVGRVTATASQSGMVLVNFEI